jgi:hypothetical protein
MAEPAEGVLPVDTVGDLMTNALQDAGVVGIDESIETPMLTRAFRQANWLLAQWARKRWLVYRIADYSFVSNGSLSYPVGNIGAGVVGINMNPRPDRIEYAFLRFLNQPVGASLFVDIPLDIIQSHEDYSRIPVKNVGTLAWRIFYDPKWPVGLLFPWPVPQASLYEIHVGFKVVLPRFTGLTQVINFPPEYEPALNFSLAKRLRWSYQMPADPVTSALARDALNVIRDANAAVGVLRMPEFLRNRHRAYDVYGDSDSY